MFFGLPESFIGFKLPLIGELRPKLEGRNLRLPEGQPMTLFGLTNRDGSWLNGGLTFHRMLPDDRQPAVATLRSKHQSSFGGGDITTEWTANVPSGYALELRPGGSEAKNGSVSSTTIVGKESVDFDGHSHFYSVRKGEVVFFDNTYDRNHNRRRDDDLSHIAIVERVLPDGTMTLVHLGSDGVVRIAMNLKHPDVRVNDAGEVINSYIRPSRDAKTGPVLTGELFRGFAPLYDLPQGDDDTGAVSDLR
jgi:hypothetical protein